MGFEPTTLRDLVGCSNHLSYWRLYGEQGPICGSRLEPHHAATQPSKESPVETRVVLKWLEHPTRSRRVVGSNPIWDSDFFLFFLFFVLFFFPSPPQINIMLLLFHL